MIDRPIDCIHADMGEWKDPAKGLTGKMCVDCGLIIFPDVLVDCRTTLMRCAGALHGVLDMVDSEEARDILREAIRVVGAIDAIMERVTGGPSGLPPTA